MQSEFIENQMKKLQDKLDNWWKPWYWFKQDKKKNKVEADKMTNTKKKNG